MNICYRCGQEGHFAKDCKVAVCNLNDTAVQQPDPTALWWNDVRKTGVCYRLVEWRRETNEQTTARRSTTRHADTAGKDTQTNDSILAIPGKIVRARTIRRQVKREKYKKQLMDTINVYPWNPTKRTVAAPHFLPLPRTSGTAEAQAADMNTQTVEIEEILDTPALEAQQSLSIPTTRQAITDSPMATSPTSNT